MKTKTTFTLFPLILIILTSIISLVPQAFSPTLSLPSPGEIADGSPGYDSWIDKEDSVQEFIYLADTYGGSYESIGKSSGNKGWDIVLFKFGNPNGGTVMVDAYLHPNEFYGYQVLRAVTTWMLSSNDADAVRIRQSNYVLIVPVVAYRFGRTNFNIPSWMTAYDPGNDGDRCGVNLNRNFGPNWPSGSSTTDGDNYSGTSADSEAESQALINAWNTYQPRIYWNLHQGSSPMTMCTARTTQAQEDASEARSLLPSIQSSLGISNGWSFNVGSSYGNGYSKDGAASRGSAGFLTEVRSGWAATESIKQDMESGDTFKQVKAMFIAMCRAVEGSTPPPDEWSITISSSSGGSTNPSGTRTLDVGESLSVSAYPDPNYVFTRWRFDGVDYSTEITIVIPSQSSGSSHTLHAVFTGTSTNSRHTISSTGSISYQQLTYDVSVDVNLQQEIAVNTLSLGFQLDGYDIRKFRDRTVLQNLAEDANFKLVRFFHHRFGEPCSSWNEATQTGTFNWNTVDSLIEAIYAIGAEPLICLGYYSPSTGHVTVPSGMSTDNDGLPRPESWANYCVYWLRHLEDRGYPVRFFEIINEPYQHYSWKDMTKLANYVEFWSVVATAMREENPNILISADCTTAEFILDYWIANGADLGFLDYHKYDSSPRDPATDAELFNRAETPTLTDYATPTYTIAEAKEEWLTNRGESLPAVCGEANINWQYSPATDSRIQTMVGAIWTALSIRSNIMWGLDYWLYWNLAGKSSTGENFGMIDGDTNEPYYAYYVEKMVGPNLAVGDSIVESSSSSDDVRILAWTNDGNVNILLICKVDASRTVALNGLGGVFDYSKIDSSSTNMQTGTIDATHEAISMNGYSVVLLQRLL